MAHRTGQKTVPPQAPGHASRKRHWGRWVAAGVVGLVVLLVLAIGLATRLTFDWIATNGHSTDELAGKQVELRAMDLQTAPLRGLDQRVREETGMPVHIADSPLESVVLGTGLTAFDLLWPRLATNPTYNQIAGTTGGFFLKNIPMAELIIGLPLLAGAVFYAVRSRRLLAAPIAIEQFDPAP